MPSDIVRHHRFTAGALLILLIAVLIAAAVPPAFSAALTADKSAISYTNGDVVAGSVEESTTLYLGALLMYNAAGYVIPGADTAACLFAGVNLDEQVDNASGADGAKTVAITRYGIHKMTLGHAITIANIGDKVYLVDDQTVDVAAQTTNDVFVGVIVGYITTTTAWVDITPAVSQTDVATHLADTADAHDASAISVADAGSKLTATEVEAALQELATDSDNHIADTSAAHAASAISVADAGAFTAQTEVEAALQEIYPKVPVLIADPGDAGAIPVTRSGTCAITTAGAETRTLAIPAIDGITLTVCMAVDGGDGAITVASAINQTGNTVITLNDAGDTVVLTAVKVGAARAWRVVVNDGAALSTP